MLRTDNIFFDSTTAGAVPHMFVLYYLFPGNACIARLGTGNGRRLRLKGKLSIKMDPNGWPRN